MKFWAGLGLFAVLLSGCSGTSNSNGGNSTGGGSGAGGSGGATSGAAQCTRNADCSAGVCSAGVCKDVSCVPSTTYCNDGAVTTCGSDGVPQGVAQHCTTGLYCLEKAGSASCNSTVCFANDALCVGTVATQCQPDGSGPKPGGTDCATLNQVCYSGQCRDRVCTPGQKSCDNGGLYLCAEDGTSRALVTSCNAGQVCDATQGACLPKLCDPGKLGCDSTRVVTCNAAGSGWTQGGMDCVAKQAVCVAGSCVTAACEANVRFCQDNKVYSCSTDGATQSLSQSCGSGQHCVESGTYAYCDSNLCLPNQPSCNGTVLATCNADGTDWLNDGIDCSLTNATCLNGKCQPTVCTPSLLFCKNNSVQVCDDQGLTSSQYQFCPQGTYCLSHGSTPDCAPTPCTPDADGCAAEKFGHCATDGLSVTSPTDCGAQKQVCTLQGCASSAVDTVTKGSEILTASTQELIGNVLLVHAARKLTLIEMDLSMPAPRALVWSVYEQTNADLNGEFDLKYQKTSTGSGSGFQSSGALSVQLEANKSYLIGVSANDGSFVYYFDYLSVPPSINFAHVIGTVDTSYSPSFDYGNSSIVSAFHQRLTTTAP